MNASIRKTEMKNREKLSLWLKENNGGLPSFAAIFRHLPLFAVISSVICSLFSAQPPFFSPLFMLKAKPDTITQDIFQENLTMGVNKFATKNGTWKYFPGRKRVGD